jgi:hypothetical protein
MTKIKKFDDDYDEIFTLAWHSGRKMVKQLQCFMSHEVATHCAIRGHHANLGAGLRSHHCCCASAVKGLTGSLLGQNIRGSCHARPL